MSTTNPPSLDLHSTALLLSAPKVMQPAANGNRQPWKGPRREGKKKKDRASSQHVKSGRNEAGALRRGSEVMHWLGPAMRVHYSARDPHDPQEHVAVHQRLSAAPADCAATPAPSNEGGRWAGGGRQGQHGRRVLRAGRRQSNCTN